MPLSGLEKKFYDIDIRGSDSGLNQQSGSVPFDGQVSMLYNDRLSG